MEREAEIVAQSGRLGAVTIATNMAGRGTDIILGGNAEFMARLKLREMLMPRYHLNTDDMQNLNIDGVFVCGLFPYKSCKERNLHPLS